MSYFDLISKEARVILSVIMVVATLALLVMIFTVPLPDNNKEMGHMAVGAFIGSFGTIIAFWFSSSKGSADKQDELNKIKNARK